MKGKEKCKALKEIRRQIAEKNDIPFAVSQCTHQGDCKGTCPKCESELRYLERELAIRQGLGKAVAIAGISIGACTAFTACSPKDTVADFLQGIDVGSKPADIDGDIEIAPTPNDEIDGGIADFNFSTPPADDTIAGLMEDAPDAKEDDTLAGNVAPFEWETEGSLPLSPSPEPDETTSVLEGDIAIEP
ncbi:MAG: hypothetical protein K2I22_09625 [Lachnospiraceae bacterium]|nr:hypothetical protein [Lachnospiraceae bacterium]